MSGLNYKKLGSTLSNICNTTQLDDATKCHYAFKYFWLYWLALSFSLVHNHVHSNLQFDYVVVLSFIEEMRFLWRKTGMKQLVGV